MSAATVVIGFVIDAMRKIVSRSIGSFASTSRQPTHDASHGAVTPDQRGGSGQLSCVDEPADRSRDGALLCLVSF